MAGDEHGVVTWQQLTPNQRRLLCALEETHPGRRSDPEISRVAIHELCAGDSRTVVGHRWIAAAPRTGEHLRGPHARLA
ncbi:hypothetical protein [Streptomonospora arabica]|uniref:Transposase n=1 Tax=Streptomonospora arabica TaxID=412417 RepID=A0ABV9SG97_9ACTN